MYGLLIKSGQGTSQILRGIVIVFLLFYRLLFANIFEYILVSNLLDAFKERGSHCAENSTKDFTEERYKGFYIDSFCKKNIYDLLYEYLLSVCMIICRLYRDCIVIVS